MDILTKIKTDHININYLLQQIIEQSKIGNNISVLLEDLFEEIREHMQAERACISEMLLEKEMKNTKSSSQMDEEEIIKFLSKKIDEEINSVFKNEDLENNLFYLKKTLIKHSQYMEKVILSLSTDCIDDLKSEELSLKFEQEKIKILISGITYA